MEAVDVPKEANSFIPAAPLDPEPAENLAPEVGRGQRTRPPIWPSLTGEPNVNRRPRASSEFSSSLRGERITSAWPCRERSHGKTSVVHCLGAPRRRIQATDVRAFVIHQIILFSSCDQCPRGDVNSFHFPQSVERLFHRLEGRWEEETLGSSLVVVEKAPRLYEPPNSLSLLLVLRVDLEQVTAIQTSVPACGRSPRSPVRSSESLKSILKDTQMI